MLLRRLLDKISLSNDEMLQQYFSAVRLICTVVVI